jgi:hypothetical protein
VNHDACFLGADIHLHVKQGAEEVQDIQQLLKMVRVTGHQLYIISIHDVRDLHVANIWTSTGRTHSYELVQLFNKQPKAEWAEPPSLFGPAVRRKRLTLHTLDTDRQVRVQQPFLKTAQEHTMHT